MHVVSDRNEVGASGGAGKTSGTARDERLLLGTEFVIGMLR